MPNFSRQLLLLSCVLSLGDTRNSGAKRPPLERPSRIVQLKQGRVQGTLTELPIVSTATSAGQDFDGDETTYSRKVEIFKGIPFAAAPVGSLRFMPPVTVTPWRELRQATEFGPVCPQQTPQIGNLSAAMATMSQARVTQLKSILPKLANQNEDCLYLNVYAPFNGKATTVRNQIFEFAGLFSPFIEHQYFLSSKDHYYHIKQH